MQKSKIFLIDDDKDILEGAELLSKGHKAEAYLEKPVEPEVLVKKARELTDRPTWSAEKRLKVLMLTCVGEKLTKPDYAKVFAETHKADDYMEKPIDLKALKKRIEKLVEPGCKFVEA